MKKGVLVYSNRGFIPVLLLFIVYIVSMINPLHWVTYFIVYKAYHGWHPKYRVKFFCQFDSLVVSILSLFIGFIVVLLYSLWNLYA